MSGTGPRFGSKLDRVGPTCWDRELAYFCPPHCSNDAGGYSHQQRPEEGTKTKCSHWGLSQA